jgi:hypothetical protein
VQHHVADHPTNPIHPSKICGTLTSVKAVQRRTGPDGAADEHGAAASTTSSWPAY